MPDEERVTYGPEIKVQNGIGSVAVMREYGGQKKPPVIFRGMVTVFYGGEAKFDFEVSLVTGRDGQNFVGWPQREYTDASGQKKYKTVVWCHDRALAAATAQAIEAFMSVGFIPTADDRPF